MGSCFTQLEVREDHTNKYKGIMWVRHGPFLHIRTIKEGGCSHEYKRKNDRWGMFSPVWEDMKKVCRRTVDILVDFESRDVR